MSKDIISDVMVETRESDDVSKDLRPAVDVFLSVTGAEEYGVGIIVTDEDVSLLVREGGKQYIYLVQTPNEAGAATQYTITDAVKEMLEVSGININGDGSFATTKTLVTLGVDGQDAGELDAGVCMDITELEEELQDILDARVIDWA